MSNLLTRFRLALSAFQTGSYTPVIQVGGVLVDLEKRMVIIPGDFAVHTTGDLRLSSDKHVIIKSGQTEEERPGYVNAVWLNPDLDEYGRPLLHDRNTIEVEHYGCIHDSK